MANHPAGPFTVRITLYSLAVGDIGKDKAQVYSSRHRSPYAAARRLATLINRKTKLARGVADCTPREHGARYVVECGDGTPHALNPFRAAFCKKEG